MRSRERDLITRTQRYSCVPGQVLPGPVFLGALMARRGWVSSCPLASRFDRGQWTTRDDPPVIVGFRRILSLVGRESRSNVARERGRASSPCYDITNNEMIRSRTRFFLEHQNAVPASHSSRKGFANRKRVSRFLFARRTKRRTRVFHKNSTCSPSLSSIF